MLYFYNKMSQLNYVVNSEHCNLFIIMSLGYAKNALVKKKQPNKYIL